VDGEAEVKIVAHAALLEFDRQGPLVDRGVEAGAEGFVDVDGAPDDLAADLGQRGVEFVVAKRGASSGIMAGHRGEVLVTRRIKVPARVGASGRFSRSTP